MMLLRRQGLVGRLGHKPFNGVSVACLRASEGLQQVREHVEKARHPHFAG